jgi:hypothetical protein
MRIQLVIDGATTEQIRDLTLAFGQVQRGAERDLADSLPSSNLPAPTVGIDGVAMRWTSPHLYAHQVETLLDNLHSIEEPRLEASVNEDDDEPVFKPRLAASMARVTWPEDGRFSLSDCAEWETDPMGKCAGRVSVNRHATGELVILCEHHFNH